MAAMMKFSAFPSHHGCPDFKLLLRFYYALDSSSFEHKVRRYVFFKNWARQRGQKFWFV